MPGTKVTLAVEKRAPKAEPTATATATATPKPPATAAPGAAGAAAAAPKPKPKAKAVATVTAPPSLPGDFVFAGATSGQLYRWTHGDAKAARLTSPSYRLETPAKIDEGYVAVHVADDQRRLVQISADGKTIAPIADGEFHRPAYSPNRGLLAVISADGRGAPADAGQLCAIDPQNAATSACALADGRRLGRPSWAPNGRSLLVLAAGRNGAYDELLSFTAAGGDATGWELPKAGYRATGIQSAAWVGNDRVAVLLADTPGAPAHLRVLAPRANGSFKVLKDFPALTGFELAATRHFLALRRGNGATADGAMILLDVDRAQPRLRNLTSGVNPVWAR